MTQPLFFSNPHASGSSFNTKRKLHAEGDSDDESGHSMMRLRSPPLKRRATFPVAQPMPDLMTDYSNSASNSDEDMAMDHDMDGMGPTSPIVTSSGYEGDGRGFVPHYDYEYGMSGSGGMGFGPGAEEDDDFTEEMMEEKTHTPFTSLPSLTPHPNPHHFSNIPPYTSNASLGFGGVNASGIGNGTGSFIRANSPLSAQPFTTSLKAPDAARGLMQPASAGPLPMDANAIERARAVHGPNCKSIPKLVISPHPDPMTGKQAMYSMCPDCGSCERAA